MAELRDAEFDRAGADLPVTVAVAVALVAALGPAFVADGAASLLGLERLQPFGGKADRLSQEASNRALFEKFTRRDLVSGHRGGLGSEWRLATYPCPESRRWPPLWISGPPTPHNITSHRRAT